MRSTQRNSELGRLLRQSPLHLVDHPLAGKYVERDDGRIGLEQGNYDPSRAKELGLLDTPLQGVLFAPSQFDDPRRRQLAEQHDLMLSGSPYTFPSTSQKDDFQQRLMWTDMPSGLIDSLKGLTVIEGEGSNRPNNAGWYNPDNDSVHVHLPRGAGLAGSDTFADTLLHELGHRADFRFHLDGLGGDSPTVPPLVYPNPRLEGIADGFADRYLRRRTGTTSTHISDSGYSTQYDGIVGTLGRKERQWTDLERAIYASARAHFTNTGENPTVPGLVDSGPASIVKDNSDEYLHMMQRTSPHVRRALMQLDIPSTSGTDHPTPLWNLASAASSRYLEGRRIGTQLSLLKEVGNRELYDDPYADGVSHEEHAATVSKELEEFGRRKAPTPSAKGTPKAGPKGLQNMFRI